MPQTPKVVCQAPEQYQWEMDDNCFSLENHINSVQASQKPVDHSDLSTYSQNTNNTC